MGKQKARRKDHFHLLDHPQVWRVPVNGERLLIVCSHRYGGKYCGLAEMSGPFDPETEVNIWTEGLQGNEGVIPTRWIVAKDVEFPFFDDLTYNDKRVTTTSCLGFLVKPAAALFNATSKLSIRRRQSSIRNQSLHLLPQTIEPGDRASRALRTSASGFLEACRHVQQYQLSLLIDPSMGKQYRHTRHTLGTLH